MYMNCYCALDTSSYGVQLHGFRQLQKGYPRNGIAEEANKKGQLLCDSRNLQDIHPKQYLHLAKNMVNHMTACRVKNGAFKISGSTENTEEQTANETNQ